MEWRSYEIYNPGDEVTMPLHLLPRRVARTAHNKLMAERRTRRIALRRLLLDNGIVLRETLESIDELNHWFNLNVKIDGSGERLEPEWYSVVNDIALFLGDFIISQAPNLEWRIFVWGTKDMSYHRSVIMGFSKVPSGRYNLDLDWVIGISPYRDDFPDNQFFRRIFNRALSLS